MKGFKFLTEVAGTSTITYFMSTSSLTVSMMMHKGALRSASTGATRGHQVLAVAHQSLMIRHEPFQIKENVDSVDDIQKSLRSFQFLVNKSFSGRTAASAVL